MMNWLVWYVALPIGLLIASLKCYAIYRFQSEGRYRILESLDVKRKNIAEIVDDRLIPYITRQNLWSGLRSMEKMRLVGYDLDPPHIRGGDPIKIYHLCSHGVRLLEEERKKRRKRVPRPT